MQDDEDDLEEDDEGDDWGERRKRHHHVSHSGDESDHSSGSRKRSHPEGKSERKLPRLNLDDALIMVNLSCLSSVRKCCLLLVSFTQKRTFGE